MNLDCIFYPKSIAIIGASTQLGSVGNDIVKNLTTQGYAGKIYPVNPRATELYNLKCYAGIKDIDDKIDLAIIVVPAPLVNTVMREVAEKKIKGAIVISAGFKEVGNVDLENELAEICLKNNITLIGPNCLGVINPENKMNASFAAIMPEKGPVAFISQSGALCAAVLDYGKKLGVGFSKFMSVGNKALIDEVEIFEYLYKDPETKIIAMYAEQLSKPHEIIASVKKLVRGRNPKPVLVIKAGRTTAGASASASHTGALAGSDAAYDALFAQSGIIRVYSISDLFEYIRVFAHNDLPKGRQTAIVTNAGGPGVLTADEIISAKLKMAVISKETEKKLKGVLPPNAGLHNPIDVIGDAKSDRYRAVLNILAKDKDVDSIIVILTPQSTTDIEKIAKVIIETKKFCKKPLVASFMGGQLVAPGIQILQQSGVSTTSFPEQAVNALATLTEFSENSRAKNDRQFKIKNTNKQTVKKIFDAAQKIGKKTFNEMEASAILEAYNFVLLKQFVAHTAEEAKNAAQKIGKKSVMKIVSKDILHKSDVGGVILNITPDNAQEKFIDMMRTVKSRAPQANIDGVLLVEMADNTGSEIILGSNKDPNMGQMIMVGLGGIYVEIFKDVSFGLAPITVNDAERMINNLKSKKILEGARGQKPLDTEALIDCLGRLSQLLTDFPEIKELDINPLLILPKNQGVRVLDARIVLE